MPRAIQAMSLLVVLSRSMPSAATIRFDPPVLYPHEGRQTSLALGDVNGDLKLDVVIGAAPVWSTRLGNGDGTFGPPITFGSSHYRVGLADLDGDGKDDLVTGSVLGPAINIYRSRGDGTFSPTESHPITQGATDFAFGDVNGDSKQDLLVGHAARTVAVFLGDGGGALRRAADHVIAKEGAVMALQDFSADRTLDLIVGFTVEASGFAYYRGAGDGTFQFAGSVNASNLRAADYVIRTGDLNSDGLLDFVVGHFQFGFETLGVVLATGRETWATEVIVPTGGGSVLSLALADFDRDGKLDIVFHNLDGVDNRVHVRQGNGDGTFTADVASWPTPLVAVETQKIDVGDLNGDGLPDIVFEDATENTIDAQRQTVVLINRSGNRPPVADAGPDMASECASPAGTWVTLDGSGSSDPDSTPGVDDIVSYEWYEDRGLPGERLLGQGVLLVTTFEPGVHEVTLLVRDRAGATDEDEVIVRIDDTLPPALTLRATPDVLWPPNHRLVEVRIESTAMDVCDPAPAIRLIAAESSEPDDAPGGQDGHTRGDIRGADLGTQDTSVLLRAERDMRGVGREYRLTYEAVDAAGHTVRAILPVRVPLRAPRPPVSASSNSAP